MTPKQKDDIATLLIVIAMVGFFIVMAIIET
jgi:preprotein translocase subunit SecE